ncbi:MAG: hemolysin III family protein [Bacteroidetes bacterium]|nr:hemolysin III family protein [Bacteroidota bacterium]
MTQSKKQNRSQDYSGFWDELVNALTHGIGVGLAIAGLVLLVVYGAVNGTAVHVVSGSIFGATMVILYLASTLYHSFPWPETKRIFKIIDHSSIYLLIAGTYTPFTLVTLDGAWGWTLFGIIWGLALAGVIFKTMFTGRFPRLSSLIYLGMGWLIVIAIKPLYDALSFWGLFWLFAGGLSYTFGVIFYSWKSLPFSHGIWHLFVLGGTICHFFAVFWHVIP